MSDHETEIDLPEQYRRLGSYRSVGLHFEAQSFYAADLDLFDRWQNGDPPDMTTAPGYVEWYALVRDHVAAGREMKRCRILDTPSPSPYQEFEVWLSRWNVEAGEQIHNLDRSTAEELGVVPAISDMWVLDGNELIRTYWSDSGDLQRITTTTAPAVVSSALHWFGVAFAAGAPHNYAVDAA